ncbi:MAG: hypothetical protein ABIB43_04235 [archaeon]
MVLNNALKTATLDEIRNVNVLMINLFAQTNQATLAFLYDNKIIDDSSIEVALEDAVIRQARTDYQTMIAEGRGYTIFADHCGRPDCLVYALEKGEFKPKEIKKIPFDHGDTVETFLQKYSSSDLLAQVRKELLNPTP